MWRTLLGFPGLVAFVVSPVGAHHSPIEFEMNQVFAFEGTVTRFEWRNPHVYFFIEDRDGVEWVIETDATPVLSRSGWTSESFAAGDAVSVRARPHKDREKTHGLLLTIEGPDGVAMASMNRVDLPRDSRAPASTTDIAGIWQAELLPVTSSVRLPLLGAFLSHPVTERGAAEKAAYDESMAPSVDCVSYPTPIVIALSALYLTEIEMRDDVILIRNEYYNTERTIHMDGRGHPQEGQRTLHGHSIGSWEDDTLVVDTRLFSDLRSAYGVGIPSGAQKHVIERFALSEDGTQLLVDIFLEDPEYLAEPFAGTVVMNYSPHLEMLGLDCDPEVARRFTLE